MSSTKRNRDQLKSRTPSPVENKKPNMATASPNTDLVDTLNLNMSSVGDENVLYNVLMKVCDGINSINKDTKAIRKSVDKLYSKVEDINKRLEVLERNKEIQDKDIDTLKNTQDIFQTEVDTVKSMVESVAEQDKEKKEFDPEVTVIASNVPMSMNEDIDQIVKRLIQEGAKLPRLEFLRARRLTSRNQHPGKVKVELLSVQDKITLLKNKKNLAEHRDFRTVFLRSSRSYNERMTDFNFRKLLQQLPDGNLYRVGANGRILKKNEPQRNAPPQNQSGTLHSVSPNIERMHTPLSALSGEDLGDLSYPGRLTQMSNTEGWYSSA